MRTMLCAVLLLPAAGALACDGREVTSPDVYAAPLCLPAGPQRIVVLDASFALGAGLDAGLPVVGAPMALMSGEALRAEAEAAGVTDIGSVTEPSLEALVALQPDLVIGFPGDPGLAEAIHAQVSPLAPTLLYASLDWQGFTRLLGEIGGTSEAVEARLDAYEARLADLRARMPDVEVSVLRITSWDFQVYLDGPVAYAPFEVLRQAGVRRTDYETTDDPALSMRRPDWEELAELDGDVLLYIVGGTNASDEDGRHEEVLANPLWQALPAVAAGRVHRVASAHWMEFSGLDSAHAVLDDVERYVLDAE